MKKRSLFLIIILFVYFLFPNISLAKSSGSSFLQSFSIVQHQLKIIYSQSGDIQIKNPELSQSFYDELKGSPRNYFINSDKDFDLYLNFLVPAEINATGRYSANVFNASGENIFSLDANSSTWPQFYDSFIRDYYYKGPELDLKIPAGKYKIEVYSKDNTGKYVLVVGKLKSFDILSILNIYWQIPLLKIQFFKTSVLQFFLTPFGILLIVILGIVLILIAFINYLIDSVKSAIIHNLAKTLLLTSGGMPEMKDEIVKLLQKPAYDVTVGFISAAAKPQESLEYLKKDWSIMKDDLGFNVEEIDIENKKESEVFRLLESKDIIYVEGGNTFYLLKTMRDCNFEKVIKKLLKEGKVYIGASAGSIVVGKTIKTAEWLGDENIINLKNLKGLNLVPFDIFVHYQSDNAEIIKQKIPNSKKRLKNLRILTDQQAILIQGKEVDLIGEGEAVII